MPQTDSKAATQTWGKRFAGTLQPATLVTLAGDLGAGKTTLVQGILEGLGATAPYPSPTFVLMNQYELPAPTPTGICRVYHADAYRVGAADFERLGFLEWCTDPAGLVLLEWPERLAEILPAERTDIILRALSETEREITIGEMGNTA
ncbi:MAG: tRNA (adenosine(37)-N6)-threonylcarbamoyltransferase complex ATPase subunit type 1 TsaE [Candidatus Moraniibacteriota bacterium]